MKKIFILLSLIIISLPAWSQNTGRDEQYPETDPASIDGGEFTSPRGLPESDYEEVPRQEQEYAAPDQNLVDPDELAPEEEYEADEEYLE